MSDAEACLGVFRGLAGEFGALEPAVWAPNASSIMAASVFHGLGAGERVDRNHRRVVSAKAEEAGHRGDPGENH